VNAKAFLVGAIVGAMLGALVAWIGVTLFAGCFEPGQRVVTPACPSPNVRLALAWGIPIGLALGFLVALLLSRGRAAARDSSR
jgi:hypothetical protein